MSVIKAIKNKESIMNLQCGKSERYQDSGTHTGSKEEEEGGGLIELAGEDNNNENIKRGKCKQLGSGSEKRTHTITDTFADKLYLGSIGPGGS